MYKIVIYCESSSFGGNEKGAIKAQRAAVRENSNLRFTWIVNSANHRLITALDELGAEYITPNLKPEFSFTRNPAAVLKKSRRIARLLRTLKADLVILIQGWILDSFDGVFAARLAHVPCCSHIPVAHSPVELGVHRFSQVRAAALSGFYRLISRYITFDEQQALRLRRWNPRAQIKVVQNFILGPVDPVTHTPEAKQRLALPADLPVLGVIGRIDFRQKAQDWLVQALSDGSFLEDKVLAFVGDGHDGDRLAGLIGASPWKRHIFQLGWFDDMKAFYDALDVLLIPSRMEGVPMVMIEALARRIPVVGTDRDGMKSWLPKEWRFPFQDAKSLKIAIENALQPRENSFWESFAPRLQFVSDERNLGRDFADALIHFARVSLPDANRTSDKPPADHRGEELNVQ